MCWILTLAIPPGLPLPTSDRERHIRPCPSDALGAVFPAHWQTFEVTSGGCACGLYSPPGLSVSNSHDADARLRERYRRQGWSAAKIERALRDRELARQHQPEPIDSPIQFREQVAEWVSVYGQVCILAYWEGREYDTLPPAERMLELSVEDFLRDGFPPGTVVRVLGMDAKNRWRKHGTGLDK